jgi:hypothetical protein
LAHYILSKPFVTVQGVIKGATLRQTFAVLFEA